MIDLQAAKAQIEGITREVLRRYANAERRRAVAIELVDAVGRVAEHLDLKMGAQPVAAKPDPIAGEPRRRRPTRPVDGGASAP